MSNRIPVTLASIPGQYIASACASLGGGAAAGDRCDVLQTIPAPWQLGTVRITFDWFVPKRRGCPPFWRAVCAEAIDGR